jgi:hypothetical protein
METNEYAKAKEIFEKAKSTCGKHFQAASLYSKYVDFELTHNNLYFINLLYF